jgi:hypothetical protein
MRTYVFLGTKELCDFHLTTVEGVDVQESIRLSPLLFYLEYQIVLPKSSEAISKRGFL